MDSNKFAKVKIIYDTALMRPDFRAPMDNDNKILLSIDLFVHLQPSRQRERLHYCQHYERNSAGSAYGVRV